jgi:hypothetical protein
VRDRRPGAVRLLVAGKSTSLSELGVEGLRFRAQGSGYRVYSLGLWGLGFIEFIGFRV